MRGIIYYTNNILPEHIAVVCRKTISEIGLPIISVSQYPIDFGENHVVDYPSAILSMFKQIKYALEKSTADIVYHCEHDCLYHPSHFEFVPPRTDTYYFNTNVWAVDADSGQALYYDGMKMTSGLCASRKILLEHYEHKLDWIERNGKFSQRLMGYEPGRKMSKGRDDYPWETYRSECPNIDIKGLHNITRKRFSLDEYRSRRQLKKSWKLRRKVPHWGKTKGRVNEFLRGVYDN